MSFVKTWLSTILSRDFEGINSWYYHKVRTTDIPALYRAYLRKWNMVSDFLLFWFCIWQKITESRNFNPACKYSFNSLRMFFTYDKRKKKKKENGKGRNKFIVSRPIWFPIQSILFRFLVAKVSPYLLSWRVLKIVRNVLIL